MALFLAAGITIGRISMPRPMPSAQSRLPVAARRASEAVTGARARLERAVLEYGGDSPRAAEAMDALVTAATASLDSAVLPEAARMAQRSVRIREATCAKDCPELADSLAAYEALLWHFEKYREALPLAQRVVEIRSRVLPPGDPAQASGWYLLAEAHRALGDFAQAEALHRKAISVWSLQGDRHAPSIAASLHYLGAMRWNLGDLPGARHLIVQALELREKVEGVNSEPVAAELNTLGVLSYALRDEKAAMTLFDRAQAIWERSLGEGHPNVARTLTNKARLLSDAGEQERARRLLLQALRIRTQAFGADYYLTARSLADLARVDVETGDYSGAEDLFLRALEIQRKDPEARGPELAATLDDLAALALAEGDPRRAITLALQGEALARGYFLRTAQGLTELDALRYETVRTQGLDVALQALARRTGEDGFAEETARVWDEMIRSRALVLDEMGTSHRPIARSPQRPGLEEVARALPAPAALVAFAKVRGLAISTRASAQYVALVLRSRDDPIRLLTLGKAEAIEAAVEDWRKEAGTDPRLEGSAAAEARYLRAARRLRALIWDPLTATLDGTQVLFVVPDGALHLVNLASLPGRNGKYLLEEGPSVHYLSSERDLIRPARKPAGPGGILALGGADFDAGSAAPVSPESFNQAAPSCAFFQSLRFAALPGTLREVEELQSLWAHRGKFLMLSGAGADEASFRKLAQGRSILHLATHGFMLDGRCPSLLSSRLPFEGGVAIGENPLALSGLVVAGANRRAGAASEQDGILTAQEIAALDLTGTEWAVLSGCETGIGQVLTGEGVLGLRRAFQVAGVGTLIMSLWAVDDGAARIWMHHLYEGHLQGLSTLQAVRGASLDMIASQRKSGGTTHPYFWGAFVAAGDWR
jgi:CHAT domain-containing protein